jgi:hypothetical protein
VSDVRRVLGALVLVLGLAACTGGGPAGAPATTPATTSNSPGGRPSGSPSALPAPLPPEDLACYRLTFGQAVSPTSHRDPVPCAHRHTSMTVFVGRLTRLFPGGLPEIDAPRVNGRVAAACARRFRSFVGGSDEAHRLSMLRPVWFTPTLAEAEAGATWFRCDVVALAAEGTLLPLTGRLRGRLDRAGWSERYGLCATAEPGTRRFKRVACARRHSWRGLASVVMGPGAYPGVAAVRSRGESICRARAKAAAADPLDYRWGFEWPTRQQWAEGRHHGVCWVPA